jgi:hypothetical protein
LILYLGPATAAENLSMFREFTAGAALVLSPDLMKRGIGELLSLKVYLGWLLPVLFYGIMLALPRRREGQQWGILLVLVAVNLGWYIVASISWLRYAFPGLAIASLFVARFFYDMTDGFRLEGAVLLQALRRGEPTWPKRALPWVMSAWLMVMILLPLALSLWQMVAPPSNAPAAMAAYLDEEVSHTALIETWEPEMGFLTDHNYHFPPPLLLNDAVGYIWLDGTPPAQKYDFVQIESPDFVLVGEFARWVNLYPPDLLAARYRLVTSVGGYELYAINE